MKLTDTQLMLLSAASQRPDHGVVIPDRLKGAAASRVVARLLKSGLLEEVRRSDDLPEWRRDDTDGVLALVVTDSGLAAIGVAPEPAMQAGHAAGSAGRAKASRTRSGANKTPATMPAAPGGKTAQLVGLLQRRNGSSGEEIAGKLGWQPHTIRAAITGLRKRGYAVERERSKAGKSVYRITGVALAGAAESGTS